MGNDPLVSVIINCRNGEKYLSQAIDSVYSQTYANWEIILWDDASTDGTPGVAGKYDEKLRYFRGEKASSLGQARNWAVEKARGEYIAFLDCDDAFLPAKLEKQVALFRDRGEVDFIYSNFFVLHEATGEKVQALKGKQPEGMVFEPFLYRYPVGILTAVLRKKAMDQVNDPFDEHLNLVEEYDFFMRFLYRFQAAYMEEPLAIYRVHGDNCSIRLRKDWPDEIARSIEKFRKLDDAFDRTHGEALRYMYGKLVELNRALLKMAQGDLKGARTHIKPYKWLDRHIFLCYLASYMPVSLWFLLTRLYGRLRGTPLFGSGPETTGE